MEISQLIDDPAKLDYYDQVREKIPGHNVMIDTGYFIARASVFRVDREKKRVKFKIHPEDAQRLRDKVEEGMR